MLKVRYYIGFLNIFKMFRKNWKKKLFEFKTSTFESFRSNLKIAENIQIKDLLNNST